LAKDLLFDAILLFWWQNFLLNLCENIQFFLLLWSNVQMDSWLEEDTPVKKRPITTTTTIEELAESDSDFSHSDSDFDKADQPPPSDESEEEDQSNLRRSTRKRKSLSKTERTPRSKKPKLEESEEEQEPPPPEEPEDQEEYKKRSAELHSNWKYLPILMFAEQFKTSLNLPAEFSIQVCSAIPQSQEYYLINDSFMYYPRTKDLEHAVVTTKDSPCLINFIVCLLKLLKSSVTPT
jgi:hypothetical protein